MRASSSSSASLNEPDLLGSYSCNLFFKEYVGKPASSRSCHGGPSDHIPTQISQTGQEVPYDCHKNATGLGALNTFSYL